jgi:hypothetical protein
MKNIYNNKFRISNFWFVDFKCFSTRVSTRIRSGMVLVNSLLLSLINYYSSRFWTQASIYGGILDLRYRNFLLMSLSDYVHCWVKLESCKYMKKKNLANFLH